MSGAVPAIRSWPERHSWRVDSNCPVDQRFIDKLYGFSLHSAHPTISLSDRYGSVCVGKAMHVPESPSRQDVPSAPIQQLHKQKRIFHERPRSLHTNPTDGDDPACMPTPLSRIRRRLSRRIRFEVKSLIKKAHCTSFANKIRRYRLWALRLGVTRGPVLISIKTFKLQAGRVRIFTYKKES
jgi:hypothetical protein